MPANLRKNLGNQGEKLAIAFLQNKNYTILECNWQCPYGELDIIAQQDEYLIFVEVKSRNDTSRHLSPLLNITRKKQDKLQNLAFFFLQQEAKYSHLQPRFDIICLIFKQNEIKIDHYINAFHFTI